MTTKYTLTVPGLGTFEASDNYNEAVQMGKGYAAHKISGRVQQGTVSLWKRGSNGPIQEFEVQQDGETDE